MNEPREQQQRLLLTGHTGADLRGVGARNGHHPARRGSSRLATAEWEPDVGAGRLLGVYLSQRLLQARGARREATV